MLKKHWKLIRRALAIIFFAIVVFVIYRYARTIDWQKVWLSTRQIDRRTLLLAGACSTASYAVYACVDLFPRSALRLRIPALRSMAIAAVCYAFNLNFGSWVGSIGFRYRLYARSGLDTEQITRVVGMSLVTNWSGYFLLAGIAFTFGFVDVPAGWKLGDLGLRIAGVLLLVALLAYLGAAAISRRRSWNLRGRDLSLPSLHVALLQVCVSSTNWLLIATILYSLLSRYVDFPTVLGVFLLASIAGAATHIPAGLGVLEGVFYGVLGGVAPQSELFAALLAYRAVYYLAPLLIAGPLYLVLETQGRRNRNQAISPAVAP